MVLSLLSVSYVRCFSVLRKPLKTTGNSIKPLILLDVDGVINAFPDSGLEDNVRVKVNIFQINYSPSIVSAINNWHDSNAAEVLWLTAWNERAVKNLAPALKFSKFKTARTQEMENDGVEKDEVACKLAQENPSRPIIWIDDELDYFVQSKDYWSTRERVLFVHTDSKLTHEDVAKVNAFLLNPVGNNFAEVRFRGK